MFTFNIEKDYLHNRKEFYRQKRILKNRLNKSHWILSLWDLRIVIICMKIINKKSKF